MNSLDSLDLFGAATPRTWIRPRYRSFDGLRGIAVTMVFLGHYGDFLNLHKVVATAWVGVDLFFVLSGFLITGILYDSLSSDRYFRDFYTRRALRIFPVFYGFFLLLFLLTPILHLYYHLNIFTFVFYIGNLTVPFTDLSLHNPTMIWIYHQGHLVYLCNLGPLWSLCVEEQFYLIWPAIVWWVRDRRRLMIVCVVTALLTLAGRLCIYHYANPSMIWQYLLDWSTYTRCDTLLMGAWLALFLRGRVLTRNQLRRFAILLFVFAVTGLALGVHHWPPRPLFLNLFVITGGFTLIGLAAMGVVLFALDDTTLVSQLLRNRILQQLGVISYGVYFYHELPIGLWQHIGRTHPQLRGSIPGLAFLSTIMVAYFSFKYYESPFLRLKKLLAPQVVDQHLG